MEDKPLVRAVVLVVVKNEGCGGPSHEESWRPVGNSVIIEKSKESPLNHSVWFAGSPRLEKGEVPDRADWRESLAVTFASTESQERLSCKHDSSDCGTAGSL